MPSSSQRQRQLRSNSTHRCKQISRGTLGDHVPKAVPAAAFGGGGDGHRRTRHRPMAGHRSHYGSLSQPLRDPGACVSRVRMCVLRESFAPHWGKATDVGLTQRGATLGLTGPRTRTSARTRGDRTSRFGAIDGCRLAAATRSSAVVGGSSRHVDSNAEQVRNGDVAANRVICLGRGAAPSVWSLALGAAVALACVLGRYLWRASTKVPSLLHSSANGPRDRMDPDSNGVHEVFDPI